MYLLNCMGRCLNHQGWTTCVTALSLWVGEGLQRGQSCCLASGVLPRGKLSPCSYFTFFPYAIGALPAVALVLSLRVWVCMSPKSVAGPLRGFFHNPNHPWFLHLEIMGSLLRPWARIPGSQGIPPIFLSITHNCGTTHSHLCVFLCHSAPPTCLDECGFFKSLVVGLPHSSIFCSG